MRHRFLSAIPVLLAASACTAQVANNTALVGTVTDASGGVVVGAKVTGINRATKVEYTGVTNAEGFYSIPFVQPGTYDVTVDMAGYSKTVAKGVEVTLNLSVRTDVALKPGSENMEVTVTAETPALSTDDALVGETLNAKQVENLPIAGRRVLELAATNPSIIVGPKTSYTGVPPGANYIGAGTREVTNSLTLDGITIMNSLISNSPVTPNADAVGAVQTQTGNYTAQYGAYMGVHINVDTKAGTNQFHGTAYDYVQNDYFNAKSFLGTATTAKPRLRFNQFGFVLGGPVLLPKLFNGRDKLFFMGSYEGLRQNQQTTQLFSVLPAAFQRGDFSALGTQLRNPATGQPYANNQVPVSPFAARFLQYYVTPNQAGLSNNLTQNIATVLNQDQTLDRVDYALSEKVRIFARYDYQTISAAIGNVVPTSASQSPTTNSNGLVAYTHILTPRLINDLRVGFNKFSSNALNYFYNNGLTSAGTNLGIPGFNADTANNNPGIPTVSIAGYTGLGAEGTNWFQDDRTLHGYDQVSYTFGKHAIMAGADIRRMAIGRAAGNTPRGQFSFINNLYTGNAAADFIAGYIYQTTTPVFQVKGSVAEWRNGFFVQDTWQASQKLTVQYGVRYELPLVPYSLNGYARVLNQSYTALIPTSTATNGTTFVPTPGFKFHDSNLNLVSPRLGLAYRATDKIVVRGGGGIYYNPNHLNAFTLASTNYPLAASVTYTYNTGANGTLTFANPTGGQAGATAPVAGTPGTYVSAFTDNYYLPTPRLYQWNADTGVELWNGGALELQYLGSKGIYLDRSYYPNQPAPMVRQTTNADRPYQLFGQIRSINNDSFSTYHGLSTIFRQRAYKGLDAQIGYTWAHSMDTSNDANGGGTAMIQNNLRADYGNSNWDIRHRFVGTITYAMPDLHQLGTIGNSLLGGWHANAIVTLQTGIPFNVSISSDQAHVLNIGTQRPNFVRPVYATCGLSNFINKTSCIDSTAYSTPSAGTFGNLHRNDLKGPGFRNINFSLFKDFAIYERLKLQFRAEAFNLFNSSNPGNPNSTLGNANFGTVSGSAFGYTPRTLQLAGKINF